MDEITDESAAPDIGDAPAAKLDRLASNISTAGDAWSHFVRAFGRKDSPHRTNPQFQDLKYLNNGIVFQNLLRAVVTAWLEGPQPSLPPPSLVLEKLKEVDALYPQSYHDAGWLMVCHIIWLETRHDKIDTTQSLDAIITELIKLWTVIFERQDRTSADPDVSSNRASPDWDALEVGALHSPPGNIHANFRVEVRMEALLQDHPHKLRISLSALGLTSYDILLRHAFLSDLSPETRVHCNGLIRVIAAIIHRRPLDRILLYIHDKLRESQAILPNKAMTTYVRKLATLPNRTLSVLAPKEFQGLQPPADGKPSTSLDRIVRGERPKFSSTEKAETMFVKAITHAGQYGFEDRLKSIWENAAVYYSETSDSDFQNNMPLKLYRLFLVEFLAKRNKLMAQTVWEAMLHCRHQPTIKEYTALLQGYRRGKDLDGAERAWHMLITSGVEPDAWAWTERIALLMEAGKHRSGVAALESLFTRWREAVKAHAPPDANLADVGDLPGAVKPPISAVNAVLTAFMKSRTSDMHEKILKSTIEHGVKPDSVTFTILIQMSLRKDNRRKALDYLRDMSASNIEAEPELFAVILNKTLRDMSNSTLAQEQTEQSTAAVLETMEQLGWSDNRFLLSILVDSLLKQHSNHDAAMVVMRYMSQKGIEPTEHVYTSLITYYFSLSPPNIDYVKMILARMNHGFLVNNVLYDRVIEGFANCGEISEMMTILRRMSHHGRRNSWDALNAALCALQSQEQFGLIEQLVEDLERRRILKWEGVHGSDHFHADGMARKGQQYDFHRRVWELRQKRKISPYRGETKE